MSSPEKPGLLETVFHKDQTPPILEMSRRREGDVPVTLSRCLNDNHCRVSLRDSPAQALSQTPLLSNVGT